MTRCRRPTNARAETATAPRPRRLPAASIALVAIAATAAALPAHAQFKTVGPDGRVTYSDRPPAEAPTPPRRLAIGTPGAAPAAALPAALREPAARHPVTLYSSSSCDVCDQARAFLRQRGIPFTERIVATTAEGDLMRRTTGGNELPSVMIGGQPIRGYAADEWGDYLDAAGYPSRSVLPAGYQAPAATRLIPPPAAPAAEPETAAPPPVQAEATPPAAPASSADNPAGLRF